jgi:hypothetical protein
MWGGMTLNFQNQSVVPIYGIKEPMKRALLQYEDTSQQYQAYRGKNTAGNILMRGGLTAVVVGLFLPIDWRDETYTNNYEAAAGLMIGGSVSEIIGLFVLQSGQENIFNAVTMYNRHRIREYE